MSLRFQTEEIKHEVKQLLKRFLQSKDEMYNFLNTKSFSLDFENDIFINEINAILGNYQLLRSSLFAIKIDPFNAETLAFFKLK